MPVPLLMTKFFIPPLPADLVPRPRLLQKLDKGLTGKLILISAPAGFGKTTLLAEWLHTRAGDSKLKDGKIIHPSAPALPQGGFSLYPLSVAWLSLDDSDNDPAQFWGDVVAALDTLRPGLGRGALDLWSTPQPPFESILTMLINDVMSLPAESVLVLDDYHVIKNDAVHAELTFLLEHLPPTLRLVIASRVDPLLPLARLRARRHLIELRAEDLRFTPAEAAALLHQITGLHLSPAEIAALDTRTEGWAAGLQLAAISLQSQADIDRFITAFTGSHRYIVDYLVEEVLQPQPASVQRFLLQTAILDQLSGPLCNAITGRADSQVILQDLARANLFVTSLDDRREWYRYHQLFAELLRHRLQSDPPPGPSLPELHSRAADWYERAGLIDRAISHALAASNFAHVENLITHHLAPMLKQGQVTQLSAWLDALPGDWLDTHPQISLLQAWMMFFNGKIDPAQRRLEQVERQLANHPDLLTDLEFLGADFNGMNLLGLMQALQAQFALLQGEVACAIALFNQALTHLPGDSWMVQGILTQSLGLAYWLNGAAAAAEQVSVNFGRAGRAGDPLLTLIATHNLAQKHLGQGHLIQAASLYRRVLQLLTRAGSIHIPFVTRMTHVDLGLLLYEWNDLAAAEEHLTAGINLDEPGFGVGARVLGVGYIGLARVYQAQGRFALALTMLQRAEELVQEFDLSGFFLTVIQAMMVPVWLAQDDRAAVSRWLQTCHLSQDDEFDAQYIHIYLNLAQAYLALGQAAAAVKLLNRLQPLVEAGKNVETRIRFLIRRALVYQALARNPSAADYTDQALACLEQALALAEPEGYIRLFADERAPMAALLLKLVTRRGNAPPQPAALPTPAYLRRLLEALAVADAVPLEAATPALVDPLTERELEVLRLLAAGLSNQEISAKLIFAPSTLKSHLKSIYAKLEAHNRLEAVVKAKELNLL